MKPVEQRTDFRFNVQGRATLPQKWRPMSLRSGPHGHPSGVSLGSAVFAHASLSTGNKRLCSAAVTVSVDVVGDAR